MSVFPGLVLSRAGSRPLVNGQIQALHVSHDPAWHLFGTLATERDRPDGCGMTMGEGMGILALNLEGSVEQGLRPSAGDRRHIPALCLCFLISAVRIAVDPSPWGIVRINEFTASKSLVHSNKS